MIRNLPGNALKYTRKGKILLGCRHQHGRLRIEVWDNGIGIEQHQLHAIFDEFHQVDNPAREPKHGLGLGLSIVRHLCKIVVVDDDPDVLELLQQLLKAKGHIVRTASDGAAALKLIAEGAMRPEILLTDYNLPGAMTGLELLTTLRAKLGYRLPGIVLTGDISCETLTRISTEDGIHLSKPVKPEVLAAAIERLVPDELPVADRADAIDAIKSPAVTYVVDDDPDVRATICDVLEAEGHLVRSFESAEASLSDFLPDVEGCLLVDANLPGMGGVALLDMLRVRGDHMPAMLINGSGGIGLAVEAMRTGACDFIEKPVSRAQLLTSIGRALDRSHDLRIIEAAREIAASRVAGLTLRQREVMTMVLAGHPSKNIAADLRISQRTVENHRAAVMHRMGAQSLPELARMMQAAATARS